MNDETPDWSDHLLDFVVKVFSWRTAVIAAVLLVVLIVWPRPVAASAPTPSSVVDVQLPTLVQP